MEHNPYKLKLVEKKPEDYLLHIKPQKDNRDVQRILNAYLSKNKKNLKT